MLPRFAPSLTEPENVNASELALTVVLWFLFPQSSYKTVASSV